MRALLIFVWIGAISLATFGQTPTIEGTPKSNLKGIRIDQTKPHVYIGFDRVGTVSPLYEGETGRRIWLRFQNNSRWRIKFCANPTTREYGETEINYGIERYEGHGGRPDTRRSDTGGYHLLAPGRSVLFSVPGEHLEAGLALRIAYRYEWEVDSDGTDNLNEPVHHAYFYASNVPRK